MRRSIQDFVRQREIQRAAQERALNEQRERARLEYLQKNKMIYEKVATLNVAAASSAAGGQLKNVNPLINGHVELIIFSTSDSDNWQYVMLDYLNETISEIKNTQVANSESYHYYFVENTGWILDFDTQILFINDNSQIIKTVPKDNYYTSYSRRTFYLAYFTDGSVQYFDGKVVTEYTGLIESSSLDGIYLTKNGSFVLLTQTGGLATVYVWNTTVGLVQAWQGPDESSPGERYNSLNVDEKADFFAVGQFNDAPNTWRTILIFDENGAAKTYLDLSPFYSIAKINSGYPTFIADNRLSWKFYGPTSSYAFAIYEGDTDTWQTTTHAKGTNYANSNLLYQGRYDGSRFTSLCDGLVYLVHDGSTQSSYNIDKYRHLDVVWSLDGESFQSYTVNNTTSATKGVDINDGNRDGYNNTSIYLGKSIFLPMWLNNSNISLLCLTSTQSVAITAASTTNLNGSQGNGLIPGWNPGQCYASFRVGDYFGIWLAYASADVYKIYNYTGTQVLSLTMSTGTRLNYIGDVAAVMDETAGIEYVFTRTSLDSSTYATYSSQSMTHYGIRPTFSDAETTPSQMLDLNEGGGFSRIFTDSGVYEFTVEELTWGYYVSDQYIVLFGNQANSGDELWKVYFYDWTGTLLKTIETDINYSTSFNAELIKDRLYVKTSDGSTYTYRYYSPTKTDSITIENVLSTDVAYDYWPWWLSNN